ncbi:uncharacterized protein Z519_05843 [Cladophialophora bantiana CBS 173.52]|uniref:Uncharacterized protein n=1 Tax=Cladophialophora bantiana (strain ATCC 10958 / CBS 173.52 / CDC B-1940 / NIH 8579) TaxID=1442370 RepID=A0A0D2HIX0_CLAB1|nr:uncharacterized protein Z519_05843 [Cladophialophora bantiana CBS 173.52]KIW93238.1 hypothetical protein Z519_05843 [Cladophialophora bantiana CBS 173.52]
MGANNSRFDSDFPPLSDQFDSNFVRHPLTPPTSTTSSYRDSIQTAASSSDHPQPIRITFASQHSMSSKAPTPARCLPGVESRQIVKLQASQVTGWLIVDDSDEIYESCDIEKSILPKRPPRSLPNPKTDSSFPALDMEPSLAEIHGAFTNYRSLSPSNHKARSILPDPSTIESKDLLNKRPVPSLPEPKKKRRLVPTKQASEIANQKFETFTKNQFGFVNPFHGGFPLTDDENCFLPDPHPGSSFYQDADHEDQGYWSKIVSPENSGEGETADEQGERLKKLLSRFHQGKQTSEAAAPPKKGSTPKLTEEEWILKQARECMLKEQEAGAERSRELREKALRRRGLLALPSSSSSSEKCKTLSDADVDNSSSNDLFSEQSNVLSDTEADNGSNNDLFSDRGGAFSDADVDTNSNNDLFSDDDPQAQSRDDLLDIAQEHVRKDSGPMVQEHIKKNSGPARTEICDELKTDQHTRDASTRSRQSNSDNERQSFRNKSPPLHVEGCHGLASNSEGLSLDAKEKRFCKAEQAECSRLTVGGSVSNLILSDQFTTNDGLDPRAQRGDILKTPDDRANPLKPKREQNGLGVRASAGHKDKSCLSIRPLSGLEMLAAKRGAMDDHQSESKVSGRPLPSHKTLTVKRGASPIDPGDIKSQVRQKPTAHSASSLPPGPSGGLTLPKNFDQYSEEEKEVIVKHEVAKERKRDLDALGGVFWTFAQLRCFSDREITERTIQTETNELYEIGKFITLVIEQGKPGKMRRTRIQDIRDNIRRRVQKAAEISEEPSDVAVLTEMRRTFSQKHIDIIDDETPKVQEEIDHWGVLRSTRSTKRHNARTKGHRKERTKERKEENANKKQVRFAGEGAQIIRSKPPKSNPVKNRQTQANRQEELIEKLRAQLKLFETADQEEVEEIQNRVAEIETELERAGQHADRDDSEEDDGAEFVFGAGHDVLSVTRARGRMPKESNMEEAQDIDEINRLEDGRQKEAGTHALQRQRFEKSASNQQKLDPELLKQMQLKKSQPLQSQGFDPELLRQMQIKRDQQLEVATDPTIIDRDAVGESDSEGDAASGATSDEDEDRQVFRYTVWGTFIGVEIYKNADHYYFMKTYNVSRAQDKVREIISAIHQYASSKNGTELDRVNVQTELHYELMEQHIVLGEDSTVEARVWIERDLVDLKKKAFRAAKRQRAVKRVATFAVYWEKTVTPLIRTEETKDADPDGFADLFEESPEDKAKAEGPVTTSISQDQIEFFTTPILANRHAKDLYLTWHFKFLPGWQNEGYRRLEDESMEQYLETLGSWGLFVREESFERVDVDRSGEERRVEEKFKVWVRKIAVKGPGN